MWNWGCLPEVVLKSWSEWSEDAGSARSLYTLRSDGTPASGMRTIRSTRRWLRLVFNGNGPWKSLQFNTFLCNKPASKLTSSGPTHHGPWGELTQILTWLNHILWCGSFFHIYGVVVVYAPLFLLKKYKHEKYKCNWNVIIMERILCIWFMLFNLRGDTILNLEHLGSARIGLVHLR